MYIVKLIKKKMQRNDSRTDNIVDIHQPEVTSAIRGKIASNKSAGDVLLVYP